MCDKEKRKMMEEYYILSAKWTYYQDNVFTFWGPNSSGYVQILEHAGVYHEDNTKMNEGIFYVPKNVIDRLMKTVSGVYNEFGRDSFSVLPNTGEIRKELGLNKYDLMSKTYKTDYFGLYFPSRIYEKTKIITSENRYQVKAKEYVSEFWYLQGVFEAKNRNNAILAAYNEFNPADYDSYIDFKKDVTCSRLKTEMFDCWSE